MSCCEDDSSPGTTAYNDQLRRMRSQRDDINRNITRRRNDPAYQRQLAAEQRNADALNDKIAKGQRLAREAQDAKRQNRS